MAMGSHRAPSKGRSKYLIVMLVVGMFVALAVPAAAGSWDDRVNGSATWAHDPGLKVAVSAWSDDGGSSFGNAEYEYYEGATLTKKFHFQAEEVCFSTVSGNQAVKMWGYWKMQEGTSPYTKPIAGVGIIDYEAGTDTLRVPLFDTEGDATAWCNGTGGWGSSILTGDYRVRSK